MKTVYQYQSALPYSLHDMRVMKMERENSDLKFYFEHGYVERKEPFRQVEGTMVLQGVDFEESWVYYLSSCAKSGDFQGKKLQLMDFIKTYQASSFEIIDELYGYFQAGYFGWLWSAGRADFIEIGMSICYTGAIVYETQE